MTINDDFTNKAEAEMKMNDAKLMELAKLRKLATAPLQERISYALKKTNNDAEETLKYLTDHHLIQPGENVTVDTIKKSVTK